MLGNTNAMSQSVTPKGLKIIGAIAVIGIVVVAIYKHFVPYTYDEQAAKNYAAAEHHIPILKPLLTNDSRFTNISLYPFTGSGGSLEISGDLFTDRDLADLKRIVDSSSPPVTIVWQVQVISQAERDILHKQ